MDLTRFKQCKAHTEGMYISNDLEPYKPCCWFRNGIMANSYSEYQEKLANMSIEENCKYCIDMEANGSTWSPRHLAEDRASRFVIGASLDNLCNLKCITCSPSNSTQIAAELENDYLFLGKFDKKYYNGITKLLPTKVEFVKEILSVKNFTELQFELFGGEPLINPKVYELLDWMTEQNFANVTSLNITTNGTTFDERIINYTEKFQYINIQLSVDGFGPMFEFMRSNANFDILKENIEKFETLRQKYNNFNYSFHYTLSWMNSLHFPEFFNWITSSYPNSHAHITKLVGPPEMSVDILSKDIREKINELVVSKLTTPTFNYNHLYELYQQHMVLGSNDITNVKQYAYALKNLSVKDKKRKTNYEFVLSEILELINSNLTPSEITYIIENKK